MTMQLLVDAAEFWPRLREDIASAAESVYVQTLSFEGDAAGLALASALKAAGDTDRRILVDSFSRHVVNDRFLYTPRSLFDRGLRREVRDTAGMVEGLRRAGVPVRFTNPAGPLFLRFPRRNHKKLAVLDGRVAYIGGINFSDHNFAWRDLMLRIEDPDLASALRDDFLATWQGWNLGTSRCFGEAELHFFDGRTNHERFERILGLIDGARERIYVECAYLTSPFLEHFAAAGRRGVAVTVVTPEANNWGLARELMIRQAARREMDIRLYRGRMTHMKVLLVDGTTLVVGSTNFDLWTYYFQQEVAAVLTDPSLIADFEERVVQEGLRSSTPCDEPKWRLRGRLAALQFRSLETVTRFVDRACDAVRPARNLAPRSARFAPEDSR